MKNCLRVFKIRGFEGGIRVPKHGGPLNSTRAGWLTPKGLGDPYVGFSDSGQAAVNAFYF
jgi:hypothetical protein